MFRLLRKLFAVLLVLWIVALVLDLRIADRSAREWTLKLWHQPQVQKSYLFVKERVTALLHKDISVEDLFKSPDKIEKKEAPAETKPQPRNINLDKMNEQDRKALDQILKKYSE